MPFNDHSTAPKVMPQSSAVKHVHTYQVVVTSSVALRISSRQPQVRESANLSRDNTLANQAAAFRGCMIPRSTRSLILAYREAGILGKLSDRRGKKSVCREISQPVLSLVARQECCQAFGPQTRFERSINSAPAGGLSGLPGVLVVGGWEYNINAVGSILSRDIKQR